MQSVTNKENDIKESNSIIMVETAIEATDIVTNILLKQKVLAIDCEGINLSKKGTLTLVQVNIIYI
ncbi:MAG: hypothetical protein MJ252_04750 [archaeon]|nr:hypothetical protein [archaeon]